MAIATTSSSTTSAAINSTATNSTSSTSTATTSATTSATVAASNTSINTTTITTQTAKVLKSPPQLEVINPVQRKGIFLSRLAANTSEEHILNFIAFKIPNIQFDQLHCRKFNIADREISSFKITPPASAFQQLISADFWPSGVIIHEFVPRKRKSHHHVPALPSAILSSASKNC